MTQIVPNDGELTPEQEKEFIAQRDAELAGDMGEYDETRTQTGYETPTPTEGEVQPIESAEEQAKQSLIGNPLESVGNAVKGAADYVTSGQYVDDVKNQFTPEGAKEFAYKTASVGAAFTDLAMDGIGHLGETGAAIDDWYDESTKLSNPNIQKTREALSVIIPSATAAMVAAPAAATAVGAAGGGALLKGIASIGTAAASDIAITGISDLAERDETLSTSLDKWLDDMGNPLGMNIPDAMVTLTDDGPEVRRQKNMLESAGLSIMGDVIGYTINGLKGPLKWFFPKDGKAKQWKANQVNVNPDVATVNATAELDAKIADPWFSPKEKKGFNQESIELKKQYEENGYSSATKDRLESYVAQSETTRSIQVDEDGIAKLEMNPDGNDFSADISSPMAPEPSRARLSTPKGNLPLNNASLTAIERGEAVGDAPQIITTPMLRKGMELDEDSSEIVLNLVREHEAMGDYAAQVNVFKYAKKDMDEAAWNIYAKAMQVGDVDELKDLFAGYKELKNVLPGTDIELITDTGARASAYAIKDLSERYLSESSRLMSARVMKTTAQEVSTMSEAARVYSGQADEGQVLNNVIDKLTYLMQEYGTNKYVAGWTLQNKKWWKTIGKNNAEANTDLLQKFKEAQVKRDQSAQGYKDVLKKLSEDPMTGKALLQAFEMTNGEVDTIFKLNQYINQQISLKGMFISDGSNLNMFARGMKNVIYNNILSGQAAFRAGLGNTSQLVFKPINAMLGLGWESVKKGSMEPLRRGMYIYGANYETQRRALSESWSTFKKANVDPSSIMDRVRKDYQFQDDQRWELLDTMVPIWQKEGNTGKLAMYSWMDLNRKVAMNPVMRWGTNAMTGIDAGTSVQMATTVSRQRAWSEVFKKHGDNMSLPQARIALEEAEKKHYASVFDKQTGLLKDEYAKHMTGEIALNLDDEVADFITKATEKLPVLTPFFMFPKTGINSLKMAMSYSPFSPFIGKYGRVLRAGNDLELKKIALRDHGIIWEQEPAAELIFKNLKAEYQGRVAMSGLIVAGLSGYALSGNIRGNGPANPSERKKMRDNYGWKPKHIKLNGQWVDYSGVEPLDSIFTLMGDIAYYAGDVGSEITEDAFSKLMWSISATFGDKAGLSGLEPIVAIANGDESAVQRFLASQARASVPLSGSLGMVSNAITSSQKDIYNDFMGYVANRIPGLSSTLPEQIDFWTGRPLNDIDNPILRIYNAMSPVKISDGDEPWRQWLIQTGFDGVARLNRDSSGQIEYTPEMREMVMKYIGDQQVYLEIAGGTNEKTGEKFKGIMYDKKFNDQIATMRGYRAEGTHSQEDIQLKMNSLPVYKELNAIIKRAKERGEAKMIQSSEVMKNTIAGKKIVDNLVKQGKLQEAIDAKNKVESRNEKLIKFNNK